MENNLVHHVKTGMYHQHYGRDNIIRNNILVESMDGQIQRSRLEDHRSFSFTNNIVYWNNDTPLLPRPTTDKNELFILSVEYFGHLFCYQPVLKCNPFQY